MTELIIAAFCVCLPVFSASADNGIFLSGTVRNGDGEAIAGATVSLASGSSLEDTTGADGGFAIGNGTAIHSGGPSALPATPHCRIKAACTTLLLTFSGPFKNGSIVLFSSNGKKRVDIQLGKTGPGTSSYTLPELPPGCYILRIWINRSSITRKCVHTGDAILIDNQADPTSGTSVLSSAAATEAIDTLVVTHSDFKPFKEAITSRNQTGIEIILDRKSYGPISVDDLPAIEEMPDPLTMNDESPVTTIEQWRIRRREMIRILEDYEYGHMPPPPGKVTAEVIESSSGISTGNGLQADYRKLHLAFGPGEALGFDLGLFTPVGTDDTQKYPVLITLGFSVDESSHSSASKAFSRGYAVAVIPYGQLGADASNWQSTAFFPAYPDYDWRDFSAWAWGISRAVDYLVTDPAIDGEKIMATGASRLGQAVLVAGAFDERIALSAPVAGGMAFRFSGREMGDGLGQGITEIVDQNTYWFGPNFEEFRNKTVHLPCDQHWLPALTAPRLFIMCNSLADEYGRAYAAAQSYLGALPVYEFLGVGENLGVHFREGGHGMYAEDWDALLDFADQYLLNKEGSRKFNVLPPEERLP